MKIDLHTHTKKCKAGDAQTREIIPSKFCEVLSSTDVGIIAITNHNVFDLQQFREIDDGLDDSTQVWPGIELDVVEQGKRGHLIVIVSPEKASEFSKVVDEITANCSPDEFTISIPEVIQNFDFLAPLYVAHYQQKKPDITDAALQALIDGTSNPTRVLKEVANAISAGIYISHGHPSIYGSDVQNWENYAHESLSLPDLRLPVESFEHFCLLLEKDPVTINTALDKKIAEDLMLSPFEDGSQLTLRVFNDINVIFGPKGTGKSCILSSIARYYSDMGVEATVFESASDKLEGIFDIKGKDLSLDLTSYGIDYCKKDIESLMSVAEVDVTNASKYMNFFRSETANKNAKKIIVKSIDTEQDGACRRQFREFESSCQKVSDFVDFLASDSSVTKVLSSDELQELMVGVRTLSERLNGERWNAFCNWKKVALLNSAIEKFRTEVERKTGSPAKPTTPGFREYALNRICIATAAQKILNAIETRIPTYFESIGSLGVNKGQLEVSTELKFQDGTIIDGGMNKLTAVKKSTQKEFSRKVREVRASAFNDDLFQKLSDLINIEDVDQIKTVYDLLLFRRYFSLDRVAYSPSSGEGSMVMLRKELEVDKEIYILDEPERSLGNDYINDVIVPILKERARAGKKVFISTHDANIAVRTLPYSSIYRCHDSGGYKTYIGNPFSNNLTNVEDSDDVLDWKKVSMKTLEGGEEAFGERGKIYGES